MLLDLALNGYTSYMRKERRKLRNKPYFCYDVNQEFHTLLKECNKYALFISSVQVTKNPEALDQRILRMCNKLDYHVVTHNKGDFVPTKITKIGLILELISKLILS